jgi:hypothetical protein
MNELVQDTHQLPTNTTQVEISRAVQEVQAAVLVAQKMPRDEIRARKRILDAAKRPTLAENASYCYPRGGQTVTGPSIRAAETLAKYWGNISYGTKELNQDLANHTSEMLAYAWDLETNTRVEKVFQVQHKRDKRSGSVMLSDSRDIYELTANQGARRVRACILGVLPSDIVEDFIKECDKTLEGSNDVPLKDRVRAMIESFEKLGVTQDMIEQRLGCKADVIIPKQLADLRKVYTSIKDNFGKIGDYFKTAENKEPEAAENVLELKGKVNETNKK